MSVDAVAAMRSRPSSTSWRSGYPRQADRGDLRSLGDATVKSRGKPPGAGRSVGRPRDPLQETADVVILPAESLMLEIYAKSVFAPGGYSE